ncbi:MAG: hypothetical protein PHC89_02065 [Candidatus Pacebacteria bacterium]|nr:hypothetical protein [Candidatus Paceibacterota bacterium]
MNYYRFQTKTFLLIIAVVAMFVFAVPHVKVLFQETSDMYTKSLMNQIQGEIFFLDHGDGSFKNTCYTGNVGSIVQDIIQEYGKEVICQTNPPQDSQILICTKLRNGSYYCVDGAGVSCELMYSPNRSSFFCKNL